MCLSSAHNLGLDWIFFFLWSYTQSVINWIGICHLTTPNKVLIYNIFPSVYNFVSDKMICKLNFDKNGILNK